MTVKNQSIEYATIMIRAEHIYKSFGDVRAVKDISMNVEKREVVGLLGPNGAGKTTTMRMITGYLAPDQGEVYINDIPVSGNSLETREMIGYLPENAPLYPDMEVTDFLAYIASVRGIESNIVSGRIREMIETCGLGDVVGRGIGKLSRGYRQRVGLAQALIHHPEILILDEPTSGLDPNQIIEIRNLIKKIGEERTVVLSTHIMQEVEATCSRAFIISEGELVGQGTLSELMLKKGGGVRYHVTIAAPKNEIEEKSNALADIYFSGFESEDGGKWQKAVFHSGRKDSAGEDIFKWAVANNWALKELHEERTSLEDVFRSLTVGE